MGEDAIGAQAAMELLLKVANLAAQRERLVAKTALLACSECLRCVSGSAAARNSVDHVKHTQRDLKIELAQLGSQRADD